MDQSLPVTQSQLARELGRLGVEAGMTVMLHASVRSVGWIVGGPEIVIHSLLDVLGPAETLMMFVGWEDGPYHLDEWPPERRKAYLQEGPPFDPQRSRANRTYSILTEYLRTWPGACRSDHPEASMAAVGRLASDLTRDHPRNHAFGQGSPLHRLVEHAGQVLVLGSPLEHVTLLHFAEDIARFEPKRLAKYRMPVLRDGQRVWEDFEWFETSKGIVEWAGEDYFRLIVQDFLRGGHGRAGLVGSAQAYLLDGKDLVNHAVAWMEAHFKPGSQQP